MNTPSPVDPDRLRARLTQAVEPVKPSPDALMQIKAGARRRHRLRWSIGSGAGVLVVAAGAAAVVTVASLGQPSALPRTAEPGYSPTATTTPTSPTTTRPAVVPTGLRPTATTGSVVSLRATFSQATPVPARTPKGPTTTTQDGASTTRTGTIAPTSASVTRTPASTGLPVQHDLDRDGKQDVVRTEFLDGKTARLVMTTAGRTVASAPFLLVQGLGAGDITYVQITGSAGRSEVLVKAPGADHTTYLLYQWAGGHLQAIAIPAPPGAPQSITTGGGGLAPMSFDCPNGDLTLNVARPTSMAKYLAGTDKTYVFENLGYVFSNGGTTLKQFTGGESLLLTRSRALGLLAKAPNLSCGAS